MCEGTKTGKCCDKDAVIQTFGATNNTAQDDVFYSGQFFCFLFLFLFFSFLDGEIVEEATIATCISLGTMIRSFDSRSYKFGMKCSYILAMLAANTYDDSASDWKVNQLKLID